MTVVSRGRVSACLSFCIFATTVRGQIQLNPELSASTYQAGTVGDPRETLIYYHANPDGGVSRGGLMLNRTGLVTRVTPSNYVINLNNGSTQALSPSVTHTACATLGLLNATSERAFTDIRTLAYYFPPSQFLRPAVVTSDNNSRGTAAVNNIAGGNNGIVFNNQTLDIALDSTLNHTLVVGNNDNVTIQINASARFRPVGADCNSTTFGPRRNPVVVVAQGEAHTYPSFFIDPIAFSNATCAKVSLGLNSSIEDRVASDANVSLYLIASSSPGSQAGVTYQSTPISLRVAPGGANFTTAVVSDFQPANLYWFNASVRSSDFTSNSATMSLRAAFMTEPNADCSKISDSALSSGLVSFRLIGPQAPVRPISPNPPPTSSGSSLSTGAIIGIAIGAAVAVIAALFLAVYLKYRNIGQKMSSRRSKSGGSPGGDVEYNQTYGTSEFKGLHEFRLPFSTAAAAPTISHHKGSDLARLDAIAPTLGAAASYLPTPRGGDSDSVATVKLHARTLADTRAEMMAASEDYWKLKPYELSCRMNNGQPIRLGKGGFGTVYLGVLNKENVAFKIVNSNSDRQQERFIREITILRACSNAHIVQFIGACIWEKQTTLVMEYMANGDLFRRITDDRSGEYSWYRKGHWVAMDIAKGLVYLHSKDIAHLDLKSPNVLLDASDKAKIGDVGLGKMCIAGGTTATTQGSVLWAAPEQLLGQRISTASDIFSFGTILWEICANQRIVSRVLRPLEVPREAPQEIVTLIDRCHSVTPHERPTAAQIYDILATVTRPPAA